MDRLKDKLKQAEAALEEAASEGKTCTTRASKCADSLKESQASCRTAVGDAVADLLVWISAERQAFLCT